MRTARLLVAAVAILLLSACSTGETQVAGGDGTAPTGPSAAGPTASTGTTGTAGDAVSLDLSASPATGAAMYSCDGVDGTWHYEPGTLEVTGVQINANPSQVDMGGGDGTLVIEGEVTIPGTGTAGFTDTIDLQIVGTADAPAMTASKVKVDASGILEGIPIDFGLFVKGDTIGIVPGAPQC